MAELTHDPAEVVRLRVERALAAEEVNLASESGRERAVDLITEILNGYDADALNGQAVTVTPAERERISRELQQDLIGLGAIAERMLSADLAQEWMVNSPTRVFRDTGERIERVPDLVFSDDRPIRAFLERLLEQAEGKRPARTTPRAEPRLPGVNLEELVSDALRMNADRIIVGESRGPETMAMLWAFATGHAGMTSVHGESADHALRNLTRFALTSGARIETGQALDWLREIDIVVHCDRPRGFDGRQRRFLPRRIDENVAVAGVDGSRATL